MARINNSIFDNFSEEALGALDFARCQRADGSFYGIAAGKQCKKGTKAAPADTEPKKSVKERMAAAYDKRKKEGGFVPKKDKASAKKMKTDFRKDVERGAQIRRARDKAIEKLQRQQAAMRKRYAKANSLAAMAIRTGNKDRSERAQKLVEKIGDRLDTLNEQMKKYTKPEGKELK